MILIAGSARDRVKCDRNCGAFVEPISLHEYAAALAHWRTHELYSGCSHGC
jgi:hypothetical protein